MKDAERILVEAVLIHLYYPKEICECLFPLSVPVCLLEQCPQQ